MRAHPKFFGNEDASEKSFWTNQIYRVCVHYKSANYARGKYTPYLEGTTKIEIAVRKTMTIIEVHRLKAKQSRFLKPRLFGE